MNARIAGFSPARIAVLALAVGLAGCSVVSPRPDVHFYVLRAPAEGARPGEAVNPEQAGPRAGIMPVSLPAYLQRPQMVLRESDSVDITVEDFRRWGEDLDLGIARVLSVSISNSLRGAGGMAMPLRTGTPVDLRVQVEVRAFEGRPGGQARLEAAWNVQKDGGAVREGFFSRRIGAGAGFEGLVQAQSALVEELGVEIAQGVVSAWEEGGAARRR